MLLRPNRIDRVVHGALHHAHVYLECRRGTAVRQRNRDERRRRDLVPVSHLTCVGSRGWWCGRCVEDVKRRDKRCKQESEAKVCEHGDSPCDGAATLGATKAPPFVLLPYAMPNPTSGTSYYSAAIANL